MTSDNESVASVPHRATRQRYEADVRGVLSFHKFKCLSPIKFREKKYYVAYCSVHV